VRKRRGERRPRAVPGARLGFGGHHRPFSPPVDGQSRSTQDRQPAATPDAHGDHRLVRRELSILRPAGAGSQCRAHQSTAQLGDSQPGNSETASRTPGAETTIRLCVPFRGVSGFVAWPRPLRRAPGRDPETPRHRGRPTSRRAAAATSWAWVWSPILAPSARERLRQDL
jgi:hypothetical protein